LQRSNFNLLTITEDSLEESNESISQLMMDELKREVTGRRQKKKANLKKKLEAGQVFAY